MPSLRKRKTKPSGKEDQMLWMIAAMLIILCLLGLLTAEVINES